MYQDIKSRKDRILDLIVTSYVDTAEPVGSRTLSRHYDVGLSPASIRNVMADLEDQGLVRQPHTSAGRIPTDKGYRYWVDTLMEPQDLSNEQKDWVRTELIKVRTVEGMASRVSKIVSELTENAGLIYIKNLKRVSFLNHLLNELIESQKLEEYFEEDAELFIEGASRIFDQPEFQDLSLMRELLRAFDAKQCFYQIFIKEDTDESQTHIFIGSENEADELGNVSVVVKDCHLGDYVLGGVAVVGPTRMKYAKVVSTVEYIAESVSESARRF